MPRKRYRPEEITAKLQQVDVLVAQGQSIADATRQVGISESRYYRWRQERGALKRDELKKPKELTNEGPKGLAEGEVSAARDNARGSSRRKPPASRSSGSSLHGPAVRAPRAATLLPAKKRDELASFRSCSNETGWNVMPDRLCGLQMATSSEVSGSCSCRTFHGVKESPGFSLYRGFGSDQS